MIKFDEEPDAGIPHVRIYRGRSRKGPVYQTDMHRFDYSFLDNGLLPARLLNITADIYTLRAMSRTREDSFKDVYTQLATIA